MGLKMKGVPIPFLCPSGYRDATLNGGISAFEAAEEEKRTNISEEKQMNKASKEMGLRGLRRRVRGKRNGESLNAIPPSRSYF